jgi:hypothetical protein
LSAGTQETLKSRTVRSIAKGQEIQARNSKYIYISSIKYSPSYIVKQEKNKTY